MRAICLTLLLAAALVVFAGHVATGASVSAVVYDDSVVRPWVSPAYSWDCSPDYLATPAASGSRALKVTLAAWGGVAFHTKTYLSTARLRALVFQVRGQSGGERLRVALYDATGNELPHHGGLKLGEYLTGGVKTSWQTVTIPLTAFAATNRSISKLAVISDLAGVQTIWLDSIRFVG